MTSSAAGTYADEIRAWLLGRLEKNHTNSPVMPALAETLPARIQLWWLLEGKQHPLLGGGLVQNWEQVLLHTRRLLSVHSPAHRVVAVPEGEIDWVNTAVQTISAGRREYHVRASRTGLSDEERVVIEEWGAWVGRQWALYVKQLGVPTGAEGAILPIARPGPDRIRWWAHIAGRSRWPLLRHVISGSLRSFLEPAELDALPLPNDAPRLFELLCVVRVLNALEESPRSIRWFDLEFKNSLRAGGSNVSMQRVPKHPILETAEFGPQLRAAIQRHSVRLPKYIDVLVEFDAPRAGFDGILIEAKSGAQTPDAAIPQLRAYRAALKAQGFGRLLVWGIVEAAWPWATVPTCEFETEEDVWVFSDAGRIRDVLESAGLVHRTA